MSKLLFLGDFFYNYNYITQDIKEIGKFIRENNYKTIINLEGTFTVKNKKIKKRGPNLKQSKIMIEILKILNVVGVCLANNHIMDYDDDGLKDTIKILKENNIKYCGAGNNLKEALKPMILEIDKKNIKIFNYGWNVEETVYAKNNKAGCAPRMDKYIFNNIKSTKEDDILINVMHWGFEYNLYPLPLDIKLAHKMIDNGVELIIGHHPHVIQPKELYKNKNIYYSLGNFYFSSKREDFSYKKFNGKKEDRCNYGLGIVYDIQNKVIEKEFIVYYNKKLHKTTIVENEEELEDILLDISNVQYNNRRYYKLVKRNKTKHNPILKGNKVIDQLKITILYILYFIYNLVKK